MSWFLFLKKKNPTNTPCSYGWQYPLLLQIRRFQGLPQDTSLLLCCCTRGYVIKSTCYWSCTGGNYSMVAQVGIVASIATAVAQAVSICSLIFYNSLNSSYPRFIPGYFAPFLYHKYGHIYSPCCISQQLFSAYQTLTPIALVCCWPLMRTRIL